MVYQLIEHLRRALRHLRILLRVILRECFPKPVRSLRILLSVSSLTYKDNSMTAVLSPGASAVLVGVDANGLATTQFPAAPTWSVADSTLFTISPSADGLSAQVVPTGVAGATVLTVVSGDLLATIDLSFEVAPPPPPPTPGVAVAMSIQLTQNP